MIFHILICILHRYLLTGILRTHNDGLLHVAQLAEHCTNIAEAMSLNPVQA